VYANAGVKGDAWLSDRAIVAPGKKTVLHE
jgi:hypothetical protein